MLFISLGGVWFMALLQRRPGTDEISLMLQTKGLALACIGLPALKNIGVSFDYYADRDIFDFDCVNGTVTFFAFFAHRVVYETALSTLESIVCATFCYFILGCNPDASRVLTALALFVSYYNTVASAFTLVYSTRLGRPEARSVAFFLQGVLAICSGVWVKRGDAGIYDIVAWVQNVNPTYWVLSPLIRVNSAGVGECLITDERTGVCQASVGDVVVESARADWIEPWRAMLALWGIWVAIRGVQLLLLWRDAANVKLLGGFEVGKWVKSSLEWGRRRTPSLWRKPAVVENLPVN